MRRVGIRLEANEQPPDLERGARAAAARDVEHVARERAQKGAVGRLRPAEARAAEPRLAQRVERRLARVERALRCRGGGRGAMRWGEKFNPEPDLSVSPFQVRGRSHLDELGRQLVATGVRAVLGEAEQPVELVRVDLQQPLQQVGVGRVDARLQLRLRLHVEARAREDKPRHAALGALQLHAEPRARRRPRVARPHEDRLGRRAPLLVWRLLRPVLGALGGRDLAQRAGAERPRELVGRVEVRRRELEQLARVGDRVGLLVGCGRRARRVLARQGGEERVLVLLLLCLVLGRWFVALLVLLAAAVRRRGCRR